MLMKCHWRRFLGKWNMHAGGQLYYGTQRSMFYECYTSTVLCGHHGLFNPLLKEVSEILLFYFSCSFGIRKWHKSSSELKTRLSPFLPNNGTSDVYDGLEQIIYSTLKWSCAGAWERWVNSNVYFTVMILNNRTANKEYNTIQGWFSAMMFVWPQENLEHHQANLLPEMFKEMSLKLRLSITRFFL